MEKQTTRTYRLLKKAIWLFSPKMRLYGLEHLPQTPSVIVANHAQIYGPIASEIHFPGDHDTWCAGEMMHREEIPDYAFQDFWSRKPAWSRWFYRFLSYAIVPVCLCLFNNANTIGVYHDSRVISTFKKTIQRLQEGANVVIFPEHDIPHNHIVFQFQDRFIDLGRMYHKRTGQALEFVPMYVAPRLSRMVLGEPIRFDPTAPAEEERRRISQALMDAITQLACQQPPHTVVPYRNVPKKYYPTNTAKEADTHEKTCG